MIELIVQVRETKKKQRNKVSPKKSERSKERKRSKGK